MKSLLTSLFLFLSVVVISQNISVIKITDLEKRINNDSDTTYIVNFWATWCAPCVKELPDFDSITKVYGNEKVKVLMISMDFKEDLDSKVLPFYKRKQIRSEVYLLDEINGNYFIPKVSEKWTGAIPATLILNNKNQYREFFEKKLNFSFLTEEIKKIKKQ
jgi:thiol-disulfide isomerase/thioredoxin